MIHKGLRWIAPLRTVAEKLTTEDVELGGMQIDGGTEIALCLGSANRDETVFEDPDVYDLHRPRQTHVSFGYGAHLCVGHYVARQARSARSASRSCSPGCPGCAWTPIASRWCTDGRCGPPRSCRSSGTPDRSRRHGTDSRDANHRCARLDFGGGPRG